jgi:hypothetical protein
MFINTAIAVWYQQIRNFMAGQGLADPSNPRSFLRPYLYCGSDWLQRQAWTAQLLNNQRQPVDYIDGTPVTTRDSQLYSQYDSGRKAPYWAPDLLDYFFDRNYANGYCAVISNAAATTDSSERVTLCPRTMLVSNNALYLRLGSINPNQNDFVQLSSCVPLTLFHE